MNDMKSVEKLFIVQNAFKTCKADPKVHRKKAFKLQSLVGKVMVSKYCKTTAGLRRAANYKRSNSSVWITTETRLIHVH